MLRKYGWLFAAIIFLLGSAPAKAQWRDLEKWEVAPFVGFETSGTFPLNSQTANVNVSNLRSDSAVSFGTFIDYSIWENFQAEFMWDRNNTSYSEQVFPNPAFVKAFNSDIDQYQFGGRFMILGKQHRIRPYVAAGVGFTHEFNSGGTPNRTDFAYSLGGGVQYQWTSHIGFRGDARYLPTYANTALQTFCDPFFGCFEANVRQYQSRGNFVGGVVFSF
jgi:opacity protein-like surface antigen